MSQERLKVFAEQSCMEAASNDVFYVVVSDRQRKMRHTQLLLLFVNVICFLWGLIYRLQKAGVGMDGTSIQLVQPLKWDLSAL